MNNIFSHKLYSAVFAAAVASVPIVAHAMGDEEFVGPFPSWANVKTSYGAAGDGISDDTAAIQNALNALGPQTLTLYFPAGTYRITQTLTSSAQLYVNIIGQDPANTTIIWAGPSGGTMLYINGVAYSRFDRLTFDGQGNAAIAVDQSWDNSTGYFDTGNEYADDVFKNAGIGLRCGNLGYGCAETSMLRDQFINNSVAGVALKNQNALDIWIWYSFFQNNYDGVTNFAGAGNFHVFNSIFENSADADISYNLTGVYNFYNNYSLGSKHFIWSGGTNAPDLSVIQGNTILDTTDPISVLQQDLGPIVFLDNVVRSTASVTAGPVVKVGSYNVPADLFSMGNTFTVSSPTAFLGSGRLHSVQDQVVARSTVNPTMPTLPGTPPNYNRQIFEASPTGSGTACTIASPCSVQQAITHAANAERSGAIHPVAHIAGGTYPVTSTITVPATVNSGIQIIGDGSYSQLSWTGTTGPVMRLLGPSKVILRDFMVLGNNYTADGIEVDNADQPGSRIFIEGAVLARSHTNLFVDALDYANVELHDFTHNYDSTTGMTSVNVVGGPSAAQGLWQGGATNVFASASTFNYIGYRVSNGAHVAVRDVWNENHNQIADVTGTSTFTYAGSHQHLLSSTLTAIALNNFQGNAALVNLNIKGNIDIIGNVGTARVLGLGLVGPSAQFYTNTSNPAAATEFLNGQTTANPPPGSGSAQLPGQHKMPDPSLLTATLDQLRTGQPALLAPLPTGVTDARFYRVFVDAANNGIHLKAAP
jgi:hypothetical protein